MGFASLFSFGDFFLEVGFEFLGEVEGFLRVGGDFDDGGGVLRNGSV